MGIGSSTFAVAQDELTYLLTYRIAMIHTLAFRLLHIYDIRTACRNFIIKETAVFPHCNNNIALQCLSRLS